MSAYSYTAFGLGIRSSIELPQLMTSGATGDVEIRYGAPEEVPEYPHYTPPYLVGNSTQMVLALPDTGTFILRNGRSITVIPKLPNDVPRLQLYLTGTVMGFLLYQRQLLVLHASSVSTPRGVVAFLGKSGQGKSSMAAALQTRGYELCADDLTAVQVTATASLVQPAFPHMKLTPPSARAIGCDPETLHFLHPEETKRGYRRHDQFCSSEHPLLCVYVLKPGASEVNIRQISPQQSLTALLRNSYPTLLVEPRDTEHLRRCAHVAGSVPVFELERPDSLPELLQVAATVEQHFRSLP